MNRNSFGTNLVLAATAFALNLSQNLNANEMNVLGAFFNVVGDQLSLIAASIVSESSSDQTSNQQNTQTNQASEKKTKG